MSTPTMVSDLQLPQFYLPLKNIGLVWYQSIDDADSLSGLTGSLQARKWSKDFIAKFGDAVLNLSEPYKILVYPDSNEKFKSWHVAYLKNKGECLARWGTTE